MWGEEEWESERASLAGRGRLERTRTSLSETSWSDLSCCAMVKE